MLAEEQIEGYKALARRAWRHGHPVCRVRRPVPRAVVEARYEPHLAEPALGGLDCITGHAVVGGEQLPPGSSTPLVVRPVVEAMSLRLAQAAVRINLAVLAAVPQLRRGGGPDRPLAAARYEAASQRPDRKATLLAGLDPATTISSP